MNTVPFNNDFSAFIADQDQAKRSYTGMKRVNTHDFMQFTNYSCKRPRLDSLSPDSDGTAMCSGGTIYPHVKAELSAQTDYSTDHNSYDNLRPKV